MLMLHVFLCVTKVAINTKCVYLITYKYTYYITERDLRKVWVKAMIIYEYLLMKTGPI